MTAFGGLVGKGTDTSAGVDTTFTVWGLYHLTAATVSVFVNGQDCGDFVVAVDGSVKVPFLGTTISTGLGDVAGVVALSTMIADTRDYNETSCALSVQNGAGAVSITAAVVIGQPYVAQGQRLPPLAPQQIASQKGEHALGLRRRTSKFAVMVQDAVSARFGTSFTPTPTGDMIAASFKQTNEVSSLATATAFSGTYWDSFDDNYTFDGPLCWQVDRPYPLVVNAVSQFISTEDQ